MRSVLMLGLPIAFMGVIGAAVLVHPWPAAATLDERSQVGVAEYETGRPDRGRRTLQSVLGADSQHPGALVGLALAAMRDGRATEAEHNLDLALQRDPANFNAHMARAFLYRSKQDGGRAKAEFAAAHQAAPKESGPVYNLAVLAVESGELATARAMYIEYLRLAPLTTDRPQVEATIADLDRKLATGKQP